MRLKSITTTLFAALILLSNVIFAQAEQTAKINTATSSIGWIGKKILGQHNGQVKIKEGSVTVKNNALTGGEFTIDMQSITCTDLTDPDYNKKLIGHLNSTDFFNVEQFPTAALKITKVLKNGGAYNLTATLTVKGITNTITFPATFKKVGNVYQGTAKITIDRTKWDIKYGSSSFFEGLGDKAIKNEIELNVNIATN
ncbi:MAG: YceI family protein [Chitinophagales bacterium]